MKCAAKCIFLLLLMKHFALSGQTTDSLLRIFHDPKLHDTVRLKAIDDIAWNYLFLDTDSSGYFAEEELGYAKRSGKKEYEAYALNHIATALYYKGKFPEALAKFFSSLKLHEQIKNTKGVATVLGNIGNLYMAREDYPQALSYFGKSLKIFEAMRDLKKTSTAYANIGLAYHELEDLKTSRSYYEKALRIQRQIGFSQGVIVCLVNLGNICIEQKDNAGAMTYLQESLKLGREMGYQQAVAGALTNLGILYREQKKYAEAIGYCEQGLALFRETGDLKGVKEIESRLSDLYNSTGRFDLALSHYKAFIVARDSIFNEENTKNMVRSEMNFEFEKKEAAAKLEQEKKEAVAAAESRRQKLVIWSVCGILLLVSVFAVFVYRSYLQKQKVNVEIRLQKQIIEEKQKEILDSIYYARRIQRALITQEKYIERNLLELKKNI